MAAAAAAAAPIAMVTAAADGESQSDSDTPSFFAQSVYIVSDSDDTETGEGDGTGGVDDEAPDTGSVRVTSLAHKRVPCHSHLMDCTMKEGETHDAWVVDEDEELFWILLNELEDDGPFKDAKTKKSGRMFGRPIDFFKLRQEVLRHRPKHIGQNEVVTGLEAFDAFLKSKNRGGRRIPHKELGKKLWKKLRTKDVKSDVPPPTSKTRYAERLFKAYKKVIVPFEKAYRWQPISSRKRRIESPQKAEPDAPIDEAMPDATVNEARTAIQQSLEEILETVIPQLDNRSDPAKAEIDRLAVGIQTTLNALKPGRAPGLATVAAVGQAGEGKSTFLNQVIAATETPQLQYNHDLAGSVWDTKSPPSAEDAWRVVAQLKARGPDSLADDVEDASHAIMTPSTAIPERIDAFGRRIIQSDDQNVVHELPSAPPTGAVAAAADANYIFGRDGRLNPDFVDIGHDLERKSYRDRMESLGLDTDAKLQQYLTIDGQEAPLNFLLPSRPGGQSGVTEFCTYLHGGAQYAMVVVYASKALLLEKKVTVEEYMRNVGSHAEDVTDLKRELLEQVYKITHGLFVNNDDDGDAQAKYTDDLEEWVDYHLGREAEWFDGLEAELDRAHESTRDHFGKQWIHQGSGRRVFDDRVYIKTRLDAVLSGPAADLIEAVHMIVPCSLLDTGLGGALVDTPGLGDPNPIKSARATRVIESADGILVFSNRSGKPTWDTLEDLGIISEVAANKGRSESGREIMFIMNVEKSADFKRPFAVPPGEPRSVRGGDADYDRTADEKEQKFCNDVVEILRKKVINAVKQPNGNLSGSLHGWRPDAGFTREMIRNTIVKPLVTDNVCRVFPVLFRAVATSPTMSDGDATECAKGTGMPNVIERIQTILRSDRVLNEQMVRPVIGQLRHLQSTGTASAKRMLEIPKAVRDEAGLLAKAKSVKKLNITRLDTPCRSAIVEQLGGLDDDSKAVSSKAREKEVEAKWCKSTASALVTALQDGLSSSWESLRKGRRGGGLVITAAPDMRMAIERGRAGQLFTDPAMDNQLAKTALACCRSSRELDPSRAWDRVFEPVVDRTLNELFNKAFAPAILMHPDLKAAIGAADGFSTEALEKLLLEECLLADAFQQHRVRRLSTIVQRELGEWQQYRKFCGDGQRRSVFCNLLNQIFKTVLSGAPERSDLEKLSSTDLAKELDKLFAPERFREIGLAALVEEALKDELNVLLFPRMSDKLIAWLGDRHNHNIRKSVVTECFRLIAGTRHMHEGPKKEQTVAELYSGAVQRLDDRVTVLAQMETQTANLMDRYRRQRRARPSFPAERPCERLETTFCREEASDFPQHLPSVSLSELNAIVDKMPLRTTVTRPLDAILAAKFPGYRVDDLILPHRVCTGDHQVFSLVRQTLDDRCDVDKNGSTAHKAAEELEEFLLRTLSHDEDAGPFLTALKAFSTQYVADVEVVIRQGDAMTMSIIKCKRGIQLFHLAHVTVRILIDPSDGTICLAKSNLKRRRQPDLEDRDAEGSGPPALPNDRRSKKKVRIIDQTKTSEGISGEQSKRLVSSDAEQSVPKRTRHTHQRKNDGLSSGGTVPLSSELRSVAPLPPPGSGFKVRLSSRTGRWFYADPRSGKCYYIERDEREWKRALAEIEKERRSRSRPTDPSTGVGPVATDKTSKGLGKGKRPK
mmetsp:Transcript_15927/g.47212  ORF Transcript_15927/g.47212 Transcript_15927/m.47212 type:complete len:1667 (+) Transcript_15927:173-5173(+)|eukprot:CAMPEP_0206301112 /NCGR_PEP_ID=MMETSP0106_2-20121207/8047_1 /ASSEMBLY_ACC=CAM_ASM_000206 /TAXON_ID=81532 /ORGANISM="Acanthoeca-like sp., Strain 10tr" /LENGTH=1666 /DNA_ID=CAMNT_0053731853 /DNA_START=77 /DNA_END=5077 /DNA_ORIENTATION=-